MVEHPDHDSKGALAQFLNYFVTVIDVVVIAQCVLLLVRIEAVVSCLVYAAPLRTSHLLRLFSLPSLSLLNIKVVNSLVFVNFFSFIFSQVIME